MKMNIRQNNAITLIALVITIIILLILAGVTIANLTGENGLLGRAGEAKNTSEGAQEIELLEAEARGSFDKNGVLVIGTLNSNVKANIRGVTTNDATSFPLKVTFTASGNVYFVDEDGNVFADILETTTPPTTAVDNNIKYNDGTNTAVIPKGFRVSSNPDEQTIETGLVVLDSRDNEWVWIPVPNPSIMYTKVDQAIELTGGSKSSAIYGSGVATNYYSNSGIISEQTRGLPNNTNSFREPDILAKVTNSGNYYDDSTSLVDSNKTNYEIAGFTSIKAMAQGLVDDYKEMIKSIEKNKGFYVGRYELTGTDVTNATEVAGKPLTNKDWYQLYYACKNLNTGTTGVVESRMIWGCQWDVMCIFVADSNHSITDSRSWGNYYDSVSPANISGYRTVQNTGYSTIWCAKKIFDIAGNCLERTQETVKWSYRGARGGWASASGAAYPASFQHASLYSKNSGDTLSTRPTLYIK